MPESGRAEEVHEEKGGISRLGEVTPISENLHQSPLGLKGRWNKRRKAGVVNRMLRGEPLNNLSRELGVGGIPPWSSGGRRPSWV